MRIVILFLLSLFVLTGCKKNDLYEVSRIEGELVLENYEQAFNTKVMKVFNEGYELENIKTLYFDIGGDELDSGGEQYEVTDFLLGEIQFKSKKYGVLYNWKTDTLYSDYYKEKIECYIKDILEQSCIKVNGVRIIFDNKNEQISPGYLSEFSTGKFSDVCSLGETRLLHSKYQVNILLEIYVDDCIDEIEIPKEILDEVFVNNNVATAVWFIEGTKNDIEKAGVDNLIETAFPECVFDYKNAVKKNEEFIMESYLIEHPYLKNMIGLIKDIKVCDNLETEQYKVY